MRKRRSQHPFLDCLQSLCSAPDFHLTVIAFVYSSLCLFIVAFSNALSDRINVNNSIPVSKRTRLPDLLMDATGAWFRTSGLPANTSDILLTISLFAIVLRVLTLQSQAFPVLRRILYTLGSAYLMRAFTIILTVLPNPLLECISSPHPNLFIDTLQIFLMRRTSCGDVFFSGHTIIFTLSSAVWSTYSRHIILRSVFSLISVLGMFSLITSTYHYTIDVLVAWWVTLWFWSMIHWSVTLPSLKTTWWGRIMSWLDGGEIDEAKKYDATEEYIEVLASLEG